MGIAAGTALQSCKLFKEMANTIQAIPPEYSANYTKKCGDATKMSDMAIEKAKNVFFEKIPDFTAIPMPDQKNFVKLDPSGEEPLKVEPSMKDVLRHVVPPQVRKM